ncbi:MAG: glycosyltransferase family 2 protein [Thermoguttaceae bacterium]
MKLIVQIPCFNEESTLAKTVADIPRRIEGIDDVRILVIDDGSTDRTCQVAREAGVDHLIRHKRNRGLGCAFRTGIDACLRLGADVIVNTDGDNQYAGGDIPRLIAPIVTGAADLVVGDRQTWRNTNFSWGKKILEAAGSFAVRSLSGQPLPDAVSGFRAFSRNAALRMNLVSSFSHTIESIIQAGACDLAIASIPVTTNGKTRKSRLFSNIPEFMGRSAGILVRTYTMYRPLRVFLGLSILLFVIGALPIARFLWCYFSGHGTGHIQSVVLGGTALLMGLLMALAGVLADLIALNRQLIEVALEKLRRLELREGSAVSRSVSLSPAPLDGAKAEEGAEGCLAEAQPFTGQLSS